MRSRHSLFLPNLVSTMSGGETERHRALKRLACEWALTAGFAFVACEVRVPSSGYRADVAALTRKPAAHGVRSAVFECKQSRADFLRDQVDEPGARAEMRALSERLRTLRALLAVHRPDLRRGESLFAEFDSYDFRGMRHETLHDLEAELETLQRKLLIGVKFSRLHKYHAADFLYLVTGPDILEPHEVPAGWGWLVREGDALVLREPPFRHLTAQEASLAWLENIALAGASASRRMIGCPSSPRISLGL
jgi:hypothetical protein